LLIAAGYVLLAFGMFGNRFMTRSRPISGIVLVQLVRGAAVMLCPLPSTALALSGFDAAGVPNASGLFNLMRNLGGAIRALPGGLSALDKQR
jgi:DHA2 family multidrug resistance protein